MGISSVGTCATSIKDKSCDAWDAAVAADSEKYTGGWQTSQYNASKWLCEHDLGCTFSNGTEVFGARGYTQTCRLQCSHSLDRASLTVADPYGCRHLLS